MMRRIIVLMTVMILPIFFSGLVLAQDLIVFPAKGQSQEQMEKDKFECYGWAKQQTGFDPMQSQPPAPAAPAQSQGSSRRENQGSGAGSGSRRRGG
jgi:hypothetical protein